MQDAGVGFPPPNGNGRKAGIGLIGIRERVRALGGTVTLSSANGAHVTVRLPLEQAATDERR